MTVPVIQQPLSADETAAQPQEQAVASSRYRLAFVMPAEYDLDDLPQPADASILIRSIPSRVMAARRYSGTWSEARYRENEKLLLDAVAKAGLEAIGTPVFARYNAPFSLWFLRRNETLVEVLAP
jgi:hypothetical protein